MPFFNTSDNQSIVATTEFESNNSFNPIPAGTTVTASIEQAGWEEYEGEWTIKLTWVVLSGEYQNRKIFQKVRVEDMDAKKRDKALKMLAAIDANCGGTLMASNKRPESNDLLSLCSRPMSIKLMVWEMNERSGNWVAAVGSANAPRQAPVQQQTGEKQPPVATAGGGGGGFDEDIPFMALNDLIC